MSNKKLHAKSQENVTHNWEKKISVKRNRLRNDNNDGINRKGFKNSYYKYVQEFKEKHQKMRKEMEDMKNNQIQFLEMENIITEK